MERYTMLLDWRNPYDQNDYNIQGNLQIQCDPYQITNAFFTEIEKNILKLIWKHKTRIATAIQRKKKRAGVIMLPDFRLYCKVIVITTVWYCHKTEIEISGKR